MRATHTFLTAVILGGAIASLTAQAKPDFSGDWIVVKGGASRSMSPSTEIRQEIHQSDVMISTKTHLISTTTGAEVGQPLESTPLYPDGRDRTHKTGDLLQTTRTHWENQTLVTIVETSKNGTVTGRETRRWSLDKEGHLVIDIISDARAGIKASTDQMVLKRK